MSYLCTAFSKRKETNNFLTYFPIMKRIFTMILMVVLVTTTSAQTLEGAPVPAPEKVATKARALMGTHPQLLLSQKRQAIAKKPSLRKTAKQLVSAETVPDTIIIVPESFDPEWYEEPHEW